MKYIDKPRVGDTVLVRCKVSASHGGYPGVAFPHATKLCPFDECDIVSIEPKFHVGDLVENSERNKGEILALTPEGIDPPQAWVKIDGNWPLYTYTLKNLRRV